MAPGQDDESDLSEVEEIEQVEQRAPDDQYLKRLVAQRDKKVRAVVQKLEKDLDAIHKRIEQAKEDGATKIQQHFRELVMRLNECREKQVDLRLERDKLVMECLEEVNVLRKQMDAVFRGLMDNARPLDRRGEQS